MPPRPARRPRANSEPEDIQGLRAIERSGQMIYVPEDADPRLLDEDALLNESVADAALAGVLTELGASDSGAKVSVSRIVTDAGVRKEAFLYECHPSEFTQGDLQESYGPGDYRIKVYGLLPGTNRKVIRANPRITIGPTRDQARRATEPAPAPAPVPAAPAPHDPALASALQMMAAAISKLGSVGNSRKEMLEEMEAMARIAGLNRPAQAGSDLTTILALLSAMKGFSGEGKITDPDAAPWDILKSAIENFAPILKARFAPGAPGAPGAPDAADAAALPGAVALPGAAASATAAEDEMGIFLKGQLLALLFAARANDSAEKWGARIYEDAPDDVLEKLQGANWFTELVALEAGFSDPALRAWLEAVRAVVLEEIAAAAPEPLLTGAEGSDTRAASTPLFASAPIVEPSSSAKPK